MTQGRKYTYAYDDFGNRTERYFDASHSKFWQYSWDGENRLVKAELKKGAQTLRTVTFKYDPFGRRIEKRVVEGTSTTTYGYVYDAEDIVLENKSVQVGGGTPVTTSTQYVHGPGIDEPLALVRNGQSYFYHADGLGSIVAITDATQTIVQRYTYDTFGMVTASDPEFENAYTYTGREWDKEIGLYYYRARYYDPMEGRFISKDPIGFAGGDVNLYRYVQNQPVGWIDPFGLSEIVFDRSDGAMTIYPGDGRGGVAPGPPQQFPASNNVNRANQNKDPYLPNGNGPAPDGTFPVGPMMPTAGGANSALGNKGFIPINLWPQDENGNQMLGPYRTGVGVHAGRVGECDGANRCGYEHATQGCVRTTPEAMDALAADPPTRITIQP